MNQMEQKIKYLTEKTTQQNIGSHDLNTVMVVPWMVLDQRRLNWIMGNGNHSQMSKTSDEEKQKIVNALMKLKQIVTLEKEKREEISGEHEYVADILWEKHKKDNTLFIPTPTFSFNDWARILFQDIIALQYNPSRSVLTSAAYTGYLRGSSNRKIYMLKLEGCAGGNQTNTDWDARLIDLTTV